MMFLYAYLEDQDDIPAFDEFYRTHESRALHIALSIMQNQQDAEDVVIDSFSAVAKNFKKILAMECHERESYFVIIVRNKARDAIRSRKKYEDNEPLDDYHQFATYDPSPEDRDEAERVVKMIHDLPDMYTAVLECRLLLEKTNQETADELHISKDLAAQRYKRGKEKLRERLREEGIMYE